jgi:hypothetical protein
LVFPSEQLVSGKIFLPSDLVNDKFWKGSRVRVIPKFRTSLKRQLSIGGSGRAHRPRMS